MKTGSTFKLANNIDKIIRTRIEPLMDGRIKPKKIVGEESAIISKSKAVLAKYEKEFKELYSIGNKRGYKYAEGDSLDLKTFFLILKQMGILQYSSMEDILNTWMIIERVSDPEESVFRLITKLIQKGKPDERIEAKIRPLIIPKLHSELSFEEFQEQLTIFFCKAKDISTKVTTFANKLSNQLKTALENTCSIINPVIGKKKVPRTFPISRKDEEYTRINLGLPISKPSRPEGTRNFKTEPESRLR